MTLEALPRTPTLMNRAIARMPKGLLNSAMICVLALAALEVAVATGFVSRHIVARPTDIARALFEGILSGELLYHAGITGFEAGAGFLIAVALGLTLGIAIAEVRLVERAVYPWLVAIQATPKIALAPLFVVWFGFGLSSKVAVAAIICLFPVMITTVSGLKSTSRNLVDLMRSMSASRWQILWLVKLPAALPHIMTGILLASIFAFTGAIVGEFVGASAGLGYLIVNYNSMIRIDAAFAALALTAMLGITFFVSVKYLSKKIVFWKD